MHVILEKTKMAMDSELEVLRDKGLDEREMHLAKTKAAEVRVVRNQRDLREPEIVFKVEELVGVIQE